MKIQLDGRPLQLRSTMLVGSGGEADVYGIGNDSVLKLFKPPSHPDFHGDPNAQEAARFRLAEHQSKLRNFPKHLPKSVVVPTGLATDPSGTIVGYSMPLVRDAEALIRFGDRSFRESGAFGDAETLSVFARIQSEIRKIHASGVVIGDFNDLNVLVGQRGDPYFIDADSMQFGPYHSRVFTAKFVDPLHCGPTPPVELLRPHDAASDWYAYLVMLFQSLLFVGPYGGVHAPKDGSPKLKDSERLFRRMTVFDPSVRYPRPARHYSVLPDDLLHAFHECFVNDRRDPLPDDLLQGIRFERCASCGKVHARSVCPDCVPTAPERVREVVTGTVEAYKLFDTAGRIVFAAVQGGKLAYVYHENGKYYREGGAEVISGSIPGMRIRPVGKRTALAVRDSVAILGDPAGGMERHTVGSYRGMVPMLQANARAAFLADGEFLRRVVPDDPLSSGAIGEILPEQTLFWVSDALGFGFYSAGTLRRGFVFDPRGSTLSEVEMPRWNGSLIDASAVFSETRIWLMLSIEEAGKRCNRAYCYDSNGSLLAESEATPGDGSWLGTIRGKCSVGEQLFCPTDEGVVRVERSGKGLSATKIFTDTARFVDAETNLHFASDGLYAVHSDRIWRIRVKS